MPPQRKALYNNYIRLTTEYINTITSYILNAKKDPKKKGKDCSGEVAQLGKDLKALAIKGQKLLKKVTNCDKAGTTKCNRRRYDKFNKDYESNQREIQEKTRQKTAASSGACFQPDLKF